MAAKKKTTKGAKSKAAVKAKKLAKAKPVAAKKAPPAKKAAPKAKKSVAKKVAAKPGKKLAAKPAKKVAAAKKPAAKPAKAVKKAAKGREATQGARPKVDESTRRDATGHLKPAYAKMLRDKSRESKEEEGEDERAFFSKPRTGDTLAEEMGESVVATATSGEDDDEDTFNQDVPEDEGGPFVETTAGQEFAEGTDASNPKGAKREPFPRT